MRSVLGLSAILTLRDSSLNGPCSSGSLEGIADQKKISRIPARREILEQLSPRLVVESNGSGA